MRSAIDQISGMSRSARW